MKSLVIRSIVEIMLPPMGKLPDAARERLWHAACELVEARMRELPMLMRQALGFLLVLFELSSLLTAGRRFSSTDVERRRQYAERASRWPLVPFRDLLKLVRALTLMGCYGDPEMRRSIGYGHGGADRR